LCCVLLFFFFFLVPLNDFVWTALFQPFPRAIIFFLPGSIPCEVFFPLFPFFSLLRCLSFLRTADCKASPPLITHFFFFGGQIFCFFRSRLLSSAECAPFFFRHRSLPFFYCRRLIFLISEFFLQCTKEALFFSVYLSSVFLRFAFCFFLFWMLLFSGALWRVSRRYEPLFFLCAPLMRFSRSKWSYIESSPSAMPDISP